MAGEYQRELSAAYRNAYDRLLFEGWEGELEEAISESPEIDLVHTRHRLPDPALSSEQQHRVDERVQAFLRELL